MPESVRKSFVILTYFVLILGTLLVFWQVRNFDFVNYDDNDYVYENPHFSHGLNRDDAIWAFTTPNIGNWLPLTWLSFMLDSQLFGLDPGWMHLVNLLLHITNTLLLFAVLRKMTGSLWRSAFVAAAFAIHPMHVESVAWVIERKDVLSAFFFMLTIAAYVGYVRGGGLFRYLLTILLFVLGLLVKPMLVTLPFVLLLLDYWPLLRFATPVRDALRRKGRPLDQIRNPKFSILNSVFEKVPFFALAAISSAVTFLVQQSSGVLTNINALPLKVRAANAFLSYTRYIGKLFWPQNLAVFYPLDADRFAFWQVTMCVLLLIVISILVIRFGRNRKYLPVGWFWFVGTLIPVIGLVQSGAQGYADRYTYISYIGLFIMIAWGLPELLSKWPQRKIALGLSMVIVLTTLGICSYRQVSFWNNSFTLFSHAIEVTQNNYTAHNNLGSAYDSIGRYQEAIENYKQAIKINPDYADAHYNLGVAYGKLGRYQDAIEEYQQAIKIKPDDAVAQSNLGVAYATLGRYQDAIEAYKQAVRIKPDFAEAYINLGIAYGNLGRYQDAVEPYKQAIKIRPDFVLAHYNLGVAYLVTGDKGAALEEYKILKTLDAEKANELFKLINK